MGGALRAGRVGSTAEAGGPGPQFFVALLLVFLLEACVTILFFAYTDKVQLRCGTGCTLPEASGREGPRTDARDPSPALVATTGSGGQAWGKPQGLRGSRESEHPGGPRLQPPVSPMGKSPTPCYCLMTREGVYMLYSLVMPQDCYFLFIWFSAGYWSSVAPTSLPPPPTPPSLLLGDTPQVHLGGPLPQPWNRPFL